MPGFNHSRQGGAYSAQNSFREASRTDMKRTIRDRVYAAQDGGWPPPHAPRQPGG